MDYDTFKKRLWDYGFRTEEESSEYSLILKDEIHFYSPTHNLVYHEEFDVNQTKYVGVLQMGEDSTEIIQVSDYDHAMRLIEAILGVSTFEQYYNEECHNE